MDKEAKAEKPKKFQGPPYYYERVSVEEQNSRLRERLRRKKDDFEIQKIRIKKLEKEREKLKRENEKLRRKNGELEKEIQEMRSSRPRPHCKTSTYLTLKRTAITLA